MPKSCKAATHSRATHEWFINCQFLSPNQLIIGGEKKEKKNILKLFKKFKAKKFYLSIDEAIILKMAINIYLSFSVTFANIIDDLCRQYSSNYSEIIQSLKRSMPLL